MVCHLNPILLGTGGESLYIDGFHMAQKLKEKAPWAFDALSTIPIDTHGKIVASFLSIW